MIMNVFAWVVMFIFLFVVTVWVYHCSSTVLDTGKDIRIPGIIISDGDGDSDSELSAFDKGRMDGRQFIEDLKNGK